MFSSLDDALLDELSSRAIVQFAPRKRVVVNENQQFEALGVLLEGRISVNIALRGVGGTVRPCMLYLVEPGETFAEFAALDGDTAVGDIAALTDVRYAVFSKEAVRSAMRRSNAFADALIDRAMGRARYSINRLAGHLTLPVSVRVAQLLLPYAQSAPGLQPADARLQKMTQAQLAAMAGSAKEVFARTISDFEDAGALRRERGHIAYLDSEKLSEAYLPAR
ncbi:MAG TPA: Crp/Fnr family transcriptional regulator [Candidatus Baltobacteraceae bacterium]|nr:Crp/Fnr family transcriptional regulator [Candidatus Baltobacteraceae bacterium]